MRLIWGVMRWGAWGANLGPKAVQGLIEAGIQHGITTFDHADIYGGYSTEGLFGRALQDAPELRQHIQLVTKCGIVYPHESRPSIDLKHYNTSAQYIQQQVENSLRALRTDRIDRLLIHRPDVLLSGEEVARTVEDLKQSGKIKEFGLSNFTPSKATMLAQFTDITEHQVEVHPLHLNPIEDGTLDQCQQLGWKPTAWSPLAGGRLLKPESARELRVADALDSLGKRYDLERAETAIAWLIQHPATISPILGTSNAQRIPGLVRAANTQFSHEEWYSVWTASTGANVP